MVLKKGNVFTPGPLPLSPNSAGEANDVQPAGGSKKEVNHPDTPSVAETLDSPPNLKEHSRNQRKSHAYSS
jgi:hypothetical protein